MSAPPEYENLLAPENAERVEGDNVPDDFKWSTSVAECTIDIRHRFMRRVYLVLVGQLILTTIVAGFIVLNRDIQAYALGHQWLMWVSVIGSVVFMLLSLWQKRRFPHNLICLALFTVCESYVVGIASSMFETSVVFNALIVTAVVFLGLSLTALQTKYDLTTWLPYLGAALFALLGFGILAIFLPSSSVELAYSAVAVVLFCGFILADTQLIQTRFHPEDEIAAAITLYLDIVNLFLNLLNLLSRQDS